MNRTGKPCISYYNKAHTKACKLVTGKAPPFKIDLLVPSYAVLNRRGECKHPLERVVHTCPPPSYSSLTRVVFLANQGLIKQCKTCNNGTTRGRGVWEAAGALNALLPFEFGPHCRRITPAAEVTAHNDRAVSRF